MIAVEQCCFLDSLINLAGFHAVLETVHWLSKFVVCMP